MCKLSGIGKEAVEGEWWVATHLAEVDGNHVTEHVAQQPVGQVPDIARPESLAVIALHELGCHRLDPPPQAAAGMADGRTGLAGAMAPRGEQLDPLVVQLREEQR